MSRRRKIGAIQLQIWTEARCHIPRSHIERTDRNIKVRSQVDAMQVSNQRNGGKKCEHDAEWQNREIKRNKSRKVEAFLR
jgi:nitrate/TMAO reductase-like tetraheme cytochrome c subunit